jgi:hypothetical protein
MTNCTAAGAIVDLDQFCSGFADSERRFHVEKIGPRKSSHRGVDRGPEAMPPLNPLALLHPD